MESSSTACASSEAVPHAESAKDPAAEPTDGEVHLAACWVSDALTATTFSKRAAAGLDGKDEPLNEEEEAAIAEYSSKGLT